VTPREGAREPTARVFARYLLFQTPGWAVFAVAAEIATRWLAVPPRWAWGACALWVAKDLVLFRPTRRAYERHEPTHGRVGEHGVADGAIDPEGWVRIGPERWRARLAPGAAAIATDAAVRVVAVEGLVLRVARLADGSADPRP